MTAGTIVQGTTTEAILSWEVVFVMPYGWCQTREEAAAACVARDLDPALCVVPVPLARGATLYEVIR